MANKNNNINKINLFLICSLYIVAGINHFWHPKVYLDLIPPYFPNHFLLNIISGTFEIIGGVLMINSSSRKLSAIIIIALLIAFIPAHIYLIQMHGCVSQHLCTAEWIAWVRLIPFQFLLIWWAWKTYKWNATLSKEPL